MPTVNISTDGTFAGTRISVDGKEISDIKRSSFWLWSSEDDLNTGSVTFDMTTMEKDPDTGLMESKDLSIGDKTEDTEVAILSEEISKHMKKRGMK